MVMALPYEALTVEQRLSERATRKQWLDELPRSSDVQGFYKEVTASLAEAKELIEDSLTADPVAVAAAADGPALRSVTARRRAAEIVSKMMNRMRIVTIDGAVGAAKLYAPQANFAEMTEEEAKALKAMRKEMEAKKKETLAAEYGNSSGGGGFGRGGARGGGRQKPYFTPQDIQALQLQQLLQQQFKPAAAGSAPVAAAAGGSNAVAVYNGGQQQQQQQGNFFQGGFRPGVDKFRYPCKACGKPGHWVRDGMCRPEDIAAKMAVDYSNFCPFPPGAEGESGDGDGTTGTAGMNFIS